MGQEICVRPPANLTAAGSRTRATIGGVGIAVAFALAVFLKVSPVGHLWRLAVGVPLFFGVIGLLQAREKT
ncbi:MAG: hypothetical protein EB084_20975 [Proteobacteria bacterium]|nr:hypothetical protein [Pseudomonadota bacterium]